MNRLEKLEEKSQNIERINQHKQFDNILEKQNIFNNLINLKTIS
jgi:hypothetical protein